MPPAGYPRGADRLAPTAFLAHTCTLLGAPEHAESLAEALASQPATAVRVGPLIGWWGPVEHHLGALCRVLGRLEDAERHLRAALLLETRMEAQPFAARTKAELARVLTMLGSVDADRFRSEARSEAEWLGAAGISAEIAAGADTG